MRPAQSAAARIADLLATYCPDGVEYKAIKEVYTRLRGTPITARKMKEIVSDNGEIKIFAGGKTVINAHEKDIPHANIIDVPAVLIQSRGVIDAIYYERPFTFKNEMWAYTAADKDSVKYLYYVIKNNIEIFRNAASGMGSLPQISLSVTEDFQIPVPPLDAQREIVRILDTFTALTTELQTERTQRLRQYEYYRDMLLSEEYLTQLSATLGKGQSSRHIEVNSYPLCELFHIKNGYTPSKRVKSYWQNGTVPWFRMEDIREHGHILDDAIQKVHPDGVKGELFPANSIMMATTATIGVHALVQVDYLANQQFTNFALKPEYAGAVDMKYVYYYFYLIDDWAKRNVNASSFASVKMEELKAYRIPVPPLAVQRQVVEILDKLETLCRDVTAGLPREIALRERQYEYYRERLLTFPRQRAQEGGVR